MVRKLFLILLVFLNVLNSLTNSYRIISQLPNLFIGTIRIRNCILLLIVWFRSFSKMLPSVKFAEEKVPFFVILRETC